GDLLERVFSVVIERFMIDFDAAALDALPLSEAIERMLIAYGSLTLSEETIVMNRLVIRECGQFPEVATAFYEAAILRTTKAMAEWLRRQCERGLIELEDPHVAAEMLRGMMIMDPQRAVMLGQRPAPSSLSDLTANPLILLKWYYFLEAKLLSLFKGLKISMMPSPTGC